VLLWEPTALPVAVEHRLGGSPAAVVVDPSTPLLWVLRDHLGLTGNQVRLWRGVVWGLHRACQRRGGVRVRAVDAVQGARVTTIEGLSRSGLHRLQRAGIEHQVPQCGYCQPGFIMAVAALLAKIPRPTAADIEGRSQHLPLRHLRQDQASDCRCSGRLGRSLAALP
jgi:isoquinoline 1-oxidoreductase subunit alpha